MKISWHWVWEASAIPGDPSYLSSGGRGGLWMAGMSSLDHCGKTCHLVGHGFTHRMTTSSCCCPSFSWSWAGSAGSILVRTYAQDRNQMPTKVDAEFVVYSKQKWIAKISDMQGTWRQAKSSQIQLLHQLPGIRISKLQTRTRQNQNRETRVVLYNITIDMLTKNRHRIKINVLTVWQMDRLEYIYTRILNILRGSWDVRRE